MAVKPFPCVLLATDTAANSGWCIMVTGQYHGSGEARVDDPVSLDEVCSTAVALGIELGLPVVLVQEYHPWRGRGKARDGLSRARGAWRAAFIRAHQLNPGSKASGAARKIADVVPAAWRSDVLGVTAGETLPALEMATAEGISGLQRQLGPDEAAAVCIARWGSMANCVLAMLPKKTRDAFGYSPATKRAGSPRRRYRGKGSGQR